MNGQRVHVRVERSKIRASARKSVSSGLWTAQGAAAIIDFVHSSRQPPSTPESELGLRKVCALVPVLRTLFTLSLHCTMQGELSITTF